MITQNEQCWYLWNYFVYDSVYYLQTVKDPVCVYGQKILKILENNHYGFWRQATTMTDKNLMLLTYSGYGFLYKITEPSTLTNVMCRDTKIQAKKIYLGSINCELHQIISLSTILHIRITSIWHNKK